MRFELNHLKYFYHTVIENSVTGAADKLCVQQPVVSKMIKILEEDLGQELFLTIGRKKVLTDLGQKVFRHCENIFQESRNIENLCFNEESVAPRMIRIGGAEHLLSFLVKSRKNNFLKLCGDTSLVLNASSFGEMIRDLENEHLDAGLCLYMPYVSDKIAILEEVEVRHHLVVHKNFKSAENVLNSFIGSREIDYKKTKSFPALRHHKEKYPDAKIEHSSNSLELHKELIRKGFGVSILPNFLIEKELINGSFVDLYPQKEFVWNLKVLINKDVKVRSFLKMIFDKN